MIYCIAANWLDKIPATTEGKKNKNSYSYLQMNRNTADAAFLIMLYALWPATEMTSVEIVLRVHIHFSYAGKCGFFTLLLVKVLHTGISTGFHTVV